MIFNTLEFLFFIVIVYVLFWIVFNKKTKYQNLLILISSYFFYGYWNWRFLFLIALSTILDFIIGIAIDNQKSLIKRKILLGISLFANLAFLAFFKYYNFFIESFIASFSFIGLNLNLQTLNIILPVGISFYTFQTLSYTIDVYNEKIKPCHKIISFATFVSFFPQLVAGPIERASNLLPQFNEQKKFDYLNSVLGLRLILWGLFKKVVVADNCARYANIIFNNSIDYNGSTLLLGSVFFAFQIYGDFSGYSDIAIGVSKLFGFNLKINFKLPYFSRDISEFWRRWHISLNTWFRDYLYIPLGGSKGNQINKIRNIFIIFLVSGFWHGANWTFIGWGLLNALLFLPYIILNRNRKYMDVVAIGRLLPSLSELLSILFTFITVCLAWILFRSDNLNQAVSIFNKIFSYSLFKYPYFYSGTKSFSTIILIIIMIIIEWLNRDSDFTLEKFGLNWRPIYRRLFYVLITITIIAYSGNNEDFIYFQF